MHLFVLGDFFNCISILQTSLWQYLRAEIALIAPLTTKAFHLRPFIQFIIIMTMFRGRCPVCKQNTRLRSQKPAGQEKPSSYALVIKSKLYLRLSALKEI